MGENLSEGFDRALNFDKASSFNKATSFNRALDKDAADLGVSPMFKQLRPRFDVHVFDSIDSTSTQLWRMLAKGYGAGTVAIAYQQSAGRGQRGRSWQSLAGGLYLSLAIEPDWPVACAAQLTCISAWGIATALNNLGIPVRVKWPNDLFFEGKKLGGILTETKLAYSSPTASRQPNEPSSLPRIKQAVVGVGINWHNPIPETGTSLVKILKRFPNSPANININCLEMLAALVLRGILQGVFYQKRVGSQVFMKGYEELLTQLGKPVSLDRNLLDQMIFSNEIQNSRSSKNLPSSAPLKAPTKEQLLSQLLNRSGEIVGLSEEGYLKVALRGPPVELPHWVNTPSEAAERVLLFAPTVLRF